MLIALLFSAILSAQHHNRIWAELDADAKTFTVRQEITYYNQTNDTLDNFILNDWNNAYSSKETPLAKRFSDEYVRAFHLAREKDRGSTAIHSVADQNGAILDWKRPANHPDLVDIRLKSPVYPNQKFILVLSYSIKMPDERFTGFGFDDKNGSFNLRDWYLTPARFADHKFVKYSNENLDDIANAVCDFDVTLVVPEGARLTSDLYIGNKTKKDSMVEYFLVGRNRTCFSLSLESHNSFDVYHNSIAEVSCNLEDKRTTDIQKALLVEQIVEFTAHRLGDYPHGKIMVTEADYKRSPMYGLNQLPAWISPYPDSFMFEMRFLKTYLNAYLKNTLKLDPRKDAWVYDAMQMELIIAYIEEHYPDRKMMGLLSNIGLVKGHHLFNIHFNDQYHYLYLIMARKNMDQPIGDPRNTFIRFNEQIAGKYKAGLGLKYLNAFVGDSLVPKAVSEFYKLNTTELQTTRADFEKILRLGTDKDIDWFFTTMVDSREIIDFKFRKIEKEKDIMHVTVKNQTGANVPVSIYGLDKDKNVVYKQWFSNITVDSTLTLPGGPIDRLVIDYYDEIPEYNARNNWKPVNKFFPNKRPIKFTFFQDIENPAYNQIFYVPSFTFNIYDGFSPGLRFHNKSILHKPFVFDIEPTYSIKTGELIGSVSFMFNQYLRESELYNIRYIFGASTFHYAPDARYSKLTPAIQFLIRDQDYRKNKNQYITLRHVLVDREDSQYIATDDQNESYSVFNARYSKHESEIIKHYSFFTDVQLSENFGKLQGEIQFRRLFNDNRRINLRLYAGMFMYRDTDSDFFDFGLDRPKDYMFDYNFYGRSETEGLFSQQFIMAEGGFKSILDTRYANQWMTTLNASFNIWNWIEVYGDAGLLKSKYNNPEFVYDSGIRLNLLPDYFELYFPVQSTNGFELTQRAYPEKIRFVVTISPGTLLNLFKRKWL